MGENGDGVTVKTGHREVRYRPGGGEQGRCNCKDWSQRGEVPARWGRMGTV